MSHWRKFFNSEYVGSWDLPVGKDVVCLIESVKRGTLKGKDGKSDAKAIIRFAGKAKPFAANITNCRAIAGMYGNDTRKWPGKRVALYVTTTSAFGETVECIRVRPRVPNDEPLNVPGGRVEAPTGEHPQDPPDADEDSGEYVNTDEKEDEHV